MPRRSGARPRPGVRVHVARLRPRAARARRRDARRRGDRRAQAVGGRARGARRRDPPAGRRDGQGARRGARAVRPRAAPRAALRRLRRALRRLQGHDDLAVLVEINIDGLVEKNMTVDANYLLQKLGGLEERIYRHRCVEAWAMTVPWTGVPLARLVAFARPTASAKYLRMETFLDPSVAPGQKQDWYPWPYVEGLTIAEATNELAFLATGIYGKPMPAQNGAPLRLVVPWKYVFKSIKSITRFTFTDQRPVSFWEQLNAHEYGFWANVNPDVSHPRWSQSSERLLGTGDRVPTQIYNGYGAEVAALYAGMFPNNKRVLFK